MENINLVEAFSEFKEFKNIDRETMMRILQDVLVGILEKRYESADNFDITVNIDKGDLEIWRNRIIVEDGQVADSNKEISYSDAIKIEPDFEVGEEVSELFNIGQVLRREILSIKQNLQNRILELERNEIYKKYKDRVGEIIVGEVYQIWKKEMLVIDDEGIEMLLPKTEQIPTDKYNKGDNVKSILLEVKMQNNTPIIVLSRTSPVFLEKLLENEVPEIFDGLITIKKIERLPGERAKIAVESYDDRIDPVGACVGMKGQRIHSIVRELNNENIDIINYTTNIPLYISRALSPAKITDIKLIEADKRAIVSLKVDQLSLAIGKNGQNIKLASRLTGYEIDVNRHMDYEEEDVDLMEFSDEIEEWIIEEFLKIGLDTAKNVLKYSVEDLVSRTDLEEGTIKEVIRILKEEFE
ncbi:MAG: transcription termination factor NusA [Bacteroidales bacterium]|nr:transcription termination factor NusA [Bacteroidales bacterium]